MKPAHRVAYSARSTFSDPLDQLVLSEIDSIANEQRERRVRRQQQNGAAVSTADATPRSRDVLEANEIAFIDRVVSWLHARPNREVILAELEARLFEPQDESVMEAASETPEQEDTPPEPAVFASASTEAESEVE